MKKAIAIGALVLAAGQAFGQWSDDFNRTSLGASWIAGGGTFANFSIVGNQGAHAGALSDAMVHATAAGPYQLSSQTIDLHFNASGTQYVALGSGYGAGNNLFLKIQSSISAPNFGRIGFYSGLNSGAGWPGASPTLDAMTAPFTDARVQAYFTAGGDTVNVAIDTNFDGVPDQTYSRSGVRAFMAGSGTGFGIGSFGPARFDDWRIMPSIIPAGGGGRNGIFRAPFAANSTDTVHQVFRSGLWQTPVRIMGVRYVPLATGDWTGNVAVNFGYTSRVPAVVAPAGLDIPTAGGGGAPNATGPLFQYFSNPAFSQTIVAGAAPLEEDFQFALNGSPGFVYFPGMGNLLMETNTVVGATLDLAVTRSDSGGDSSASYTTTRFGSGTTVGIDSAPQVQLVAMPYTPDVLPTWPHIVANAIPFAAGQSLMHQAHHAGTLAPLGVGGSGKVAIQGVRYAPMIGTDHLNGQVTLRMGYTSRVPGVPAPVGLDIPTAGGGGAPNSSGPMRLFMDRTMNSTFASVGSENFQLDLHQTPFVYDPAQGNLLIEMDTNLASGVATSRSNGTPEAMRAYRSSSLGNLSDLARVTRVKFVTTPVTEQVYPDQVQTGGLVLPFSPGNHVMHQVFSAAQFGTEPVRIDSIAYAPQAIGSITSNVTVRLGYTSRQPHALPPVGLSIPDAGGDGAPNATVGPMAVFRSGSLPVNVVSQDPNNYQIVIKGDAPFLYNPAMGNLLVEVVSSASGLMPVYSWNSATSGSSISVNSTQYGQNPYISFAPLVRFTYFKDLYPCVADMNGDNTVDLNDFFAFFGCWDLSGQCADVDGVPGVDLNDFFAFLGSWDVGC